MRKNNALISFPGMKYLRTPTLNYKPERFMSARGFQGSAHGALWEGQWREATHLMEAREGGREGRNWLGKRMWKGLRQGRGIVCRESKRERILHKSKMMSTIMLSQSNENRAQWNK